MSGKQRSSKPPSVSLLFDGLSFHFCFAWMWQKLSTNGCCRRRAVRSGPEICFPPMPRRNTQQHAQHAIRVETTRQAPRRFEGPREIFCRTVRRSGFTRQQKQHCAGLIRLKIRSREKRGMGSNPFIGTPLKSRFSYGNSLGFENLWIANSRARKRTKTLSI